MTSRTLRRVAQARRALPQNVRALGWVSFANDLASELIYPILLLFLTITLGAPVAILGLIEGVAEGVAVGLRGIAGWLSDRAGERRRPWIVVGYTLSGLARPVVAAAPAWGYVLGGRLGDRLGKAARTAPRDALIRGPIAKPLACRMCRPLFGEDGFGRRAETAPVSSGRPSP